MEMAKCLKKFANTMRLRNLLFMQRTVTQQEVQLLYREPGILTGYRPSGKSWLYYIGSIFQLHNETVNIWTHIIACALLTLKLREILVTREFAHDCESVPLVGFCICVLASTFLSVIAHTFLSKSPLCHYVCLQMDYAGVGIYGLGKCILFFHISCSYDVYKNSSWFYLPFNVCLSWIVMVGGCIAKLFYRRPYPFRRRLIQLGSGALHAVLGGIPLGLRFVHCFRDESCGMESVSHHLLWITTMIISLFFFSSHLPEKIFPGTFDYVFQGHNLFHVIISCTALFQIRAAYLDVKYCDFGMCSCHQVSGWTIFNTIIVYCIGSVVIMLCLRKYVRERIKSDEKIQNWIYFLCLLSKHVYISDWIASLFIFIYEILHYVNHLSYVSLNCYLIYSFQWKHVHRLYEGFSYRSNSCTLVACLVESTRKDLKYQYMSQSVEKPTVQWLKSTMQYFY